MMTDSDRRYIGILAYPSAQTSAVYGLVDLFETANKIQTERGGQSRFVVEAIKGHSQSALMYDAIILPPSLNGGVTTDEITLWADWLMARHQDGALMCSICAGAFMLAKTGLLHNRPATTHWALADQFSDQFPDVILNVDELIIDDGDIITAGGLMAWTDLGLRLIDRFSGPAVMLATARFFLVDPSGREQRFYSCFSPRFTHGDKAILKAQHWLQSHSDEKLTVPMIASVSGLGERTFLRRFHKATKLNPSEYLQQLRVGKARDLIELSPSTIDEISWRVGYQDVSAFRRIFHKITGLTPSEYRKRFSVS